MSYGYIAEVTSPCGSGISLFFSKDNWKLRIVVYYRPINKLTVVAKYHLPRIDEILDRVGDANTFPNSICIQVFIGFGYLPNPSNEQRSVPSAVLLHTRLRRSDCVMHLRHFRNSMTIFSGTCASSRELTSTTF